jgi:bifunctional non-homologous end joining protein LigD
VMRIWDRGTYTAHKFDDREVMVTMHGERVRGRYVLFHTRGDDWMIHRMDPPEDPTREPMPERVEPMLAARGSLATAGTGDRAYEPRWRGERALVYVEGGRARVTDAAGEDLTDRLPELRGIGGALGTIEAILDGMVVAPGSDESLLERRLGAGSASTARRLAKEAPISFVAFDLVWLEGHSTMESPYRERRELLEQLDLNGPAWQTPHAHAGDARAFLQAAVEAGLPG